MRALLCLVPFLSAPCWAQSADEAAPASVGSSARVVGTSPGSSNSTVVLYDNGGFITGIGNGAGGADTSEIEAGFNTYGYNHSVSFGYRVADDFMVPAGAVWAPDSMNWYAYQTGAPPSGTITSVNVRIWRGDPMNGGTIIAGDATTNRLVSSTFSNTYRVTNATLTNSARAVMELHIDLSWAPSMCCGLYFIDVQADGSLTSGPWCVPTVPRLATDNALQFDPSTGSWAPVSDNTAQLSQDFPFKLLGGGSPPVTTYCTSKTTSNGCTPIIGSSGTPSATTGSGFLVTGTNFINNKSCLLFYGVAGQAALPFQGGILCLKAPIKRTPATGSFGNPPPNDCSGAPSIDMNLFAVGGMGGTPLPALLVAGTTVNCQWWGRDPGFASPNNTMLSDGLEYVVSAGGPLIGFQDMVFNGEMVQFTNGSNFVHSATLTGVVTVAPDGATSGSVLVVFDDGLAQDITFTAPDDCKITDLVFANELDLLTGGPNVQDDDALLNGNVVSLLSLAQQLETESNAGAAPAAMSSGSRPLLALAALGKTPQFAQNVCAAQSVLTDSSKKKWCKLAVNSALMALVIIAVGLCLGLCTYLAAQVPIGPFWIKCATICIGGVFVGAVAAKIILNNLCN